ncbi:ATP-binding protein [Parabacteroides johnsonii]
MELTALLKQQIKNRMNIDNPWWTLGGIDADYKKMPSRLYINLFYPLVKDMEVRRSVILMGPRRVGKTVLIYHSIQRLIEDGVSPQQIIYVSVETPIYNQISLEILFELAKEAVVKTDSKETFYVFFDEIQYLKDWEVHLKSLVDTYRNCKFVASGSAAAALRKRSMESGAGRFTDFMLPPLTFNEFIHLKNYSSLIVPAEIEWKGYRMASYSAIDMNRLNELFLNYINYGGYPEVVFSEQIQSNPGQYVRHDIIDKVLLRDLPSLYGITDVQELNTLFTVIAYHSGNEFSYEKLSKESGVKKETIRKYIEYLEAAFLIRVIHKTNENAKRFQRATSFKIYLTNPSLRCALFQPLQSTDEEMGNMVETTIFAQWIQRNNAQVYYANWKNGRKQGEVDLVGLHIATQKPAWAVEIKWSNHYYEHPGDLRSLLEFLDNNDLPEAIVTSISKSGDRQQGEVRLLFIPAAIYAYMVGQNTFEKKQQRLGL